MQLKQLELESLDYLDSAVSEAFRKHLKRAADDCYDRPADPKGRKVTLEVTIEPVFDQETRACTEVRVQAQVFSAIPKHRSRVHSVRLQPNGALLFNPDSPDDVNQATLMDEDDHSFLGSSPGVSRAH